VTKRAEHPWFPGPLPVYLSVYQECRKGRETVWVLRSLRVVPLELLDDVQLLERFGPGRWRVDGRQEGGRLCGASHFANFPDDSQNVPCPSISGEEPSESKSDQSAIMFKFMESMMQRTREENDRIRADNQANLDAFAKITQTVLAARGEPAPREDNSRFFFEKISSVEKRYDDLLKENIKLQVESAKVSAKKDSSFESEVVAAALPKLFDLLGSKRERSERASVQERMRVEALPRAAARAPVAAAPPAAAEAAPPPAAPPAAPPAPRDAGDNAAPPRTAAPLSEEERAMRLGLLGWELPPLEVIRERLDKGEGLGVQGRTRLAMLRDLGLLPPEYLETVVSYI
jgi:hypothetical protein